MHLKTTLTWPIYTLLANCVKSPHQCVRFSSQPVEVYVNFIRVPPAIFKRPPPTAYKISQFTANSVLSQSVRSWGVWISLVAQKTVCRICIEYIQLCAVTMHKLHKCQNNIICWPPTTSLVYLFFKLNHMAGIVNNMTHITTLLLCMHVVWRKPR